MDAEQRKALYNRLMNQMDEYAKPIQPGDENIYPETGGFNSILPQNMKASLKALKETEQMKQDAGMMGGTLAKVGGAAEAAFPAIRKMFQAGGISFPAESTAQALKIKDALEAAGKIGKGRSLTVK